MRTHIRTVASDRTIQNTPVADLIDTDTLTREQRRELVRTGAAEWRTNADATEWSGNPDAPDDPDITTHPDVLVRVPVARRPS